MTLELAFNNNCLDFKNKLDIIVKEFPLITYNAYNESYYKDKNKAYKLKNEWSAKKIPFVAIYEKDKMIKGFYSEADSDVIDSLIKYLNKN